MKPTSTTRRELLKLGSLLAGAGAAGPFALNLLALSNSARASSNAAYRAMVFINLAGGNDSSNMVLATDTASWTSYTQHRDTSAVDGAASIALTQSSLLPIAPTNAYAAGVNVGRSFALHPALPNLARLFGSKNAAIVANVGPLIGPVTAAQYKAGSAAVPANLFSHNSQTATWQAFDGSARFGWGGRVGDILLSQNSGAAFTCVSVTGAQLFLQGNQVVSLEAGYTGLPGVNGLLSGRTAATSVYPSSAGNEGADTSVAALNKILTQPRGTGDFASDLVSLNQQSIASQAIMAQALVASIPAPPANNPLASQFQAVLRIMASNVGLGVTRQVFYTQLGGFDTHDGQVTRQQTLYSQLDAPIAYFETNATALGLWDSAVLFTGSEFGRTFTSNGDGTDHGWGSHHWVVGGSAAVNGGDIYGRFPQLGPNNTDSTGNALLPSLAVDQYAATLATWLGVPNGTLNSVFPNLPNFAAANLGFMGA